MKISLSETATVLGRSERQVRYLIKSGKLTAAKEGGQWRVATSDLPLTEDQRHALNSRMQVARGAFEKGLEPLSKALGGKEEGRRQYSVTDLAAFQAGLAIRRMLAIPEAGSPWAPGRVEGSVSPGVPKRSGEQLRDGNTAGPP